MDVTDTHRQYLVRHKVPHLFDRLARNILTDLPEDPQSYLAAQLSRSGAPPPPKPSPTGQKLRLTVLHSNDIHGDFDAETTQGDSQHCVGGMALLSGYIHKVRETEPNVLYVIAGDMLQGSVLDKEFKGISTIQLVNYLSPTVTCIGNHEVDYGFSHLLFLEKIARFPIVTANLYLKGSVTRLFQPFLIHRVEGYTILFIGLVTSEVMTGVKSADSLTGEHLEITDYAEEVGKVCDAFKTADIDLTVLVTHIGFEEDKLLAAQLKPEWGVDLIIGGHSHTFLKEAVTVNGIIIATAGCGSDQIGRFDLVVNTDTNSIEQWQWQLVPVDATTAVPDPQLGQFLATIEDPVSKKYNSLVTKFSKKLTHPMREVETELGNLFADILMGATKVDVVLLVSGSLRKPSLGPTVTLGDLESFFPYDSPASVVTVSGKLLRKIFTFWQRAENRRPGNCNCFQVNRGVKAVYSDDTATLHTLAVHGKPVGDDDTFSLLLTDYPLKNSESQLGVTAAELGSTSTAAVSVRGVLLEHLKKGSNHCSSVEGRLVYTTATTSSGSEPQPK